MCRSRVGALACGLLLSACAGESASPPLALPVDLSQKGSVPAIDEISSSVLPTLDTPLPPGRNVVYSAAFPLAWAKLKSDITHGAVRIRDGGETIERLNRISLSEDVLPREHFVAAGATKAVGEEIRREMAARFPGMNPDLEGPQDAILVYAYLQAHHKFGSRSEERR